MPQFLVKWEIDITADNEWEAAEEALRIQKDPERTATFFKVMDRHTKEVKECDLYMKQEA